MLSVFTNYATEDDMINLSLTLLSLFGYIEEKELQEIIKIKEKELTSSSIEIIRNFPICNQSNAKKDRTNNKSSVFKIKYSGVTIVHGVEEICNIDEYIEMLLQQNKVNSI